tara:strand:- start:231 stop:716 length:486 start_codon:yes stop_codon:yes gene_type:complete
MATFVKLDSNNIIRNVTRGDDNWSSPDYIKIEGTSNFPRLGDLYNSSSNTLEHELEVIQGNYDLVTLNDLLFTENIPVSLSFSKTLNSSALSSSLKLTNSDVSEFRIDSKNLTFLLEPNVDSENFLVTLDINLPSLANDSSLNCEALGWDETEFICSGSFS